MVRCKVCGYITREGKLKDKCPACGAPAKAFEPYTDPMSSRRRFVLNLSLHPIATHFPITLVVAELIFFIAIPFLAGDARDLLVNTIKILVLLTPAVVILTLALGWIDGRIRFHKIKVSKILKRKILLSSILFVVSLAVTLIAWLIGLSSFAVVLTAILLSAVNFVLVFLLGLLGSSVNQSAFPGK